jgi:hypothetical protein
MARSILRAGPALLVCGALALVIGCGKGDSVQPKVTGPVDPAIQRIQISPADGKEGKPAGDGKPAAATSSY